MTSAWDDLLLSRLTEVAASGTLLVAADYDGTLAPLVDDPALAEPDRESLRLLAELAGLRGTHVAVVSGRARTDLARFTGLPGEVHLVGSHGSEFDADWSDQLPESVVDLRERIAAAVEHLAESVPGATVEHKPTSVAFHVRRVEESRQGAALAAAEALADDIEGVTVKHGKLVVELSALAADKGTAVLRLAGTVHADVIVFVGDDETDEDVFTRLGVDDLGVKVGEGESAATARVADTVAVQLLLAHLLQLRTAILAA